MADMDTYDNEPRTYDEYPRGGDRSRSRSPGADRDGDTRIRDDSYSGRGERDVPPPRQNGGGDRDRGERQASRGGEPGSEVNEGSNLFVTGIHPRLTEEEITVLFEKHGRVEKCNIMRDPHTRESRGFGFVKMVAAEDADAAKDALQGEVYEGRTLSIEKARRARPRTPTPGKYFGPPKRDDRPARGGYRDRYDDRGPPRRYDDRRGGPRAKVAVSFTHIIKSAEPAFSVLVSRFILGESFPMPVYLSLLPIIGGCGLAAATELNFNMIGFMGAMISNLAFVFRNIFSKRGMKGKSVSGMNYYACLSIMSLVILAPFAIAMEGPQMWAAGWQRALADVGPNVLWWIGAQSVFYHLYNQVSYMSLDQISPLTFSIGNTMKRISVIVSSIIIFRTPVRPVNALGAAIAIFGTFLYSQAKQ